MRATSGLLLLLITAFVFTACERPPQERAPAIEEPDIQPPPTIEPHPAGGEVDTTGTVIFVDLEGGFYGILGDDGHRYDPIGLDEDYQQDSLRVRFAGIISQEQVTIRMWGTVLEIQEIERLE